MERNRLLCFESGWGHCAALFEPRGGLLALRLFYPRRTEMQRAIEDWMQGHPGPRRESELPERLEDYLAGRSRQLRVSLAPIVGPPYHLSIWQEMRAIPYGQTRSYGELARAVGNPSAYRAVGQACRRNPLPLIVPCHRVLSAGGQLGHYTLPGGAATKRRLLELEGADFNL